MDETTGILTDETIIKASNQHCIDQGIDPEQPPVFAKGYSTDELGAQLSAYSEVIEVIEFFVKKFLSSVKGNPILVTISDDAGYLLAFQGDATIIDLVGQVGIKEGVQMNKEVGTNSIALALEYQRPFQLTGRDHFHYILHHLVCCTAPFYKENGQEILGTISFMADIDVAHPHLLPLLCTMADSIEREILLRRGNSQLQLLNRILLETNYLGVIITDQFGTVVNINENSLAMLHLGGEHQESVVGTSVFEIRNVGAYFQHVIIHHVACAGLEVIQEKNGLFEHYMLDVLPVYDANGYLARVIGSLRSITEMKRTEEVLRNTEKLVVAGQLAMSIAHEIRNPLTTVKGMLQLANKDSRLLHYDLIMSEVERMNLIVSEFLILGKPQAAHYMTEQCSTILLEVLNIFAIQVEMNNIALNTKIHYDAEIECDRNQIKQIFLNILRNSMEALPFGGSITVTLDVKDEFQVITFTDNGEGMNKEVLDKLGEPFHTTRGDGNGLGFMIVKKIVTAHRGYVAIASEEGVGTAVTIYLPMAHLYHK
ncbi:MULTISPECIES: ATP-binding protein [Paenibacillus]|uniref:ATP-binding protein n=1 Tax=Paenibacillus TaxID=44249 RepID=UPI00096FB6D0|nr:ATP-binding protein [Paenibacillus odorifer]OME15180.1 PAS domain-containing sensor histidine kinase [Paenibacillus odorifer]